MSPNKRPKRILVAEDDPTILNLLSLQLEIENYQVIQATDGAAAWAVLQSDTLPDLVLLDILMPRLNGFEICRRIRATPRLESLPVVFLTALQDSSSRLEGLEAGANDFLGKPWSKAELYARIRTILRLKEAQDTLREQHRRLGLIYDISRELSAYLDLDLMLCLMLTRSAHVVGAEQGSIILITDRKAWRKIELVRELESEIITPPLMNPVEQLIASWLPKSRRPLLITDTTRHPGPPDWESVRSLVATPFIFKEHFRGFMLLIHSQPNWFDNEHLDLLNSIAQQAAVSIENALLFSQVQEERLRSAGLISSMEDAVIATDEEQRVVLLNPAGAQLLGFSQQEIEGKPVAEKIQDKSLLALFNRVAEENQPLASEIRWSEQRTLYATVSPVSGVGQVAVIQDITSLKALQAMQLANEQEKAARVRAVFEQYMSPVLVDRALGEHKGLMEKRERREVALLFADLRGFTRLTVRFSPDDVVSILNDYFTVMTDIAYSYNGTILDIAGDELMVGFGVPFDMPAPAIAAVQAAVEMQTVFTELSKRWWQTHRDKRVGLGIGIDYGEVIAGNVGSPTRMNYALVGRPVNTAHALVQTATDGEILFSKAVEQRLTTRDLTHPVRTMPGVQLKGYDQQDTVFSIRIDRPSADR